jgi:ABC-type phosphate/phosphonate transport system permease subunit
VGFVITAIALFQFHRLMGALILIIVMVTLADRISDKLRKRLPEIRHQNYYLENDERQKTK